MSILFQNNGLSHGVNLDYLIRNSILEYHQVQIHYKHIIDNFQYKECHSAIADVALVISASHKASLELTNDGDRTMIQIVVVDKFPFSL